MAQVRLKTLAVIAAIVAVSTLSSLGLLVIFEIAYRMVEARAGYPKADALDVFRFKPYVMTALPPGPADKDSPLGRYFGISKLDTNPGVAIQVNKQGFRGREFPPPQSKTPGTIRLVITGGSAAVSWNIDEKRALDTLLAERVQREFPGKTVEVYNLAGAAWKSFQELIAIQWLALPMDPDVIIHFSGFNDSFHSYFWEPDIAYNAGLFEVLVQKEVVRLRSGAREFLNDLRALNAMKTWTQPEPPVLDRPAPSPPRSLAPQAAGATPGKMATLPNFPLDLDAIAARSDFDPYGRRVADYYLRNEALMARSANLAGATLISALQPSLYLKKAIGPREEGMLRNPNYAETVNFSVQNYLRIKAGLERLARDEPNVSFIDLSSPFDEIEGDVFHDNVHFSAEGYAVVADRLAAKVVTVLQSRSAPSPRN
ncbi:MAG: hypothetical protein HQL42_13750 [Alphaproteobacteria bacterium]|nr:hypothetical protein [Alphaproteobacteria bacterium]